MSNDQAGFVVRAPHTPLEVSRPGGTYTLRTNLDFSGFDPFPVSLKARVLVESALDDVLINGRSTGVKLPALPATATRRFCGKDGKFRISRSSCGGAGAHNP